MAVLKRYDLRRKFNLGSSCGKPVCCIARISMTVIRSIGTTDHLVIWDCVVAFIMHES